MSNLLELIKAVNHDISVTKNKFVYYNNKTGEIIKISNKKEKSKYDMIEVDKQVVSEIVTGDKPLSKFRVEYNLEIKSFYLTEIDTDISLISVSNKFYQIPKTTKDNYDLKIIQNNKNREWIIQIDESLLDLKDVISFRNKKMRFSVTHKNDPNILYRKIIVNLDDLLKNMCVSYPFKSNKEIEEVSVYTPKYFKFYIHEVANE